MLLEKMTIVHLADQDIPRLLRNPKIRYCVHNSPPSVSVWNKINPIYTLQNYYPKIHLILPSRVSFSISNQNFVLSSHLLHALYTPVPPHAPCFNGPIILWGEQLMDFLITFSPISHHFIPLRYNISPELFSDSPEHHVLKHSPEHHVLKYSPGHPVSEHSPNHPVPKHRQCAFFL